ncbi:MAG TPA: hypothetical protein VIG51_01755 [Candidatus Baltobacteraceae bacterium]|jgi:hypothetical protein
MRLAKGYSRDTASVAPILTRERSILTSDDRDPLGEIDAQAQADLLRLREATAAAHERLEAGAFALREKTGPPEPQPVEDAQAPPNPGGALVSDFGTGPDGDIPVWDGPS